MLIFEPKKRGEDAVKLRLTLDKAGKATAAVAAAEAAARAAKDRSKAPRKGDPAPAAAAAAGPAGGVGATLQGYDHHGNRVTFTRVAPGACRSQLRRPLRRWADAWGRYRTYRQRLVEVLEVVKARSGEVRRGGGGCFCRSVFRPQPAF